MSVWDDYNKLQQNNATQQTSVDEQPQVWDDADSSNALRLKGADAPEVFHDITPTGDTNNERSKVYKQLMALNGISEAEAIAQVDAEAEAEKVDPNLGLKLKTLRAAGKYTGPYTSHEIYQMGKEATMATDETEVGKFDDRNNVLQATTSFDDTQAKPVETAATPIDSLQKGYFGRGLLDIDTTNEMIAKGYMVPGADPTTASGRKDYELQLKLADKAKRLGLGLWKDPNQAKMMEAITDTSYSKKKAKELGVGEAKSYLDQITALPQAIAAGFGKATADTADTYTELAGDVVGRGVGLVDENYGRWIDKNIDLGTGEEKKEFVNSIVGYDDSFTKENMQKVADLYDIAMDKVTWYNPTTWMDMDTNALLDAGKTAFKDIETAGYSLGYIAPALMGLAGKAAKKVVGGAVEKHLDDAAENLKLVAKGEMTKAAAKELADKSLKGLSKTDRTKLFLVNNADALHYGAMMNNDQMDEFIKNNGGEDATALRAILGTGFNALGMKMDIGVLNSIIKPGTSTIVRPAVNKFLTGLGNEKAKAFILSALETASRAGVAGLKEMPQEWTQSFIEEFNSVYGTKDASGNEIGAMEAFDKSRDAAGVGAIAGLAGGVQTSLGVSAVKQGPKLALETVKETGKLVASQVKKSVDKRIESNREKKVKEFRDSRVNSMTAKNEDYSKYGKEQAVKSPDVETINLGGEDVKIFEEPVNLKVQASNAEEYSDLLEEQKDRVVQSLYEVDQKGNIVGLSETAKQLEVEGKLEERVNKVNAWLEKYKNEYDTKDIIRKADQKIVDSITEDMILNNKLTEEQKVELAISAANKNLAKQELTDKELQFFHKYTADVNRIIQDEKVKNSIPDSIIKTVDYLTGPDAKVHLESMYAKQDEEQNIKDMEEKVATAKEELKDINDDTLRAEKQQEIDDLNEDIIIAQEKIDDAKIDINDTELNPDNIVETDKDRVELDTLTEEEIRAVYQNEIESKVSQIDDAGNVTYIKDWNAERLQKAVDETVKKTYESRKKYRFGKDVQVEADYDKLSINVNAKKAKKGLVVNTTEINGNTLVDSVIAGTPETALGKYDKNSSKLLHRVLGRINASVTNSDYKTAKTLMEKVKSVAKKDKLKEIFTDTGIEEGEGAVLVTVALGAINAAVVTDTLARQRVATSNVSGQTANMAQNEYWASEANLLTQIGKDFLTSRGIKLTKGTPTQQAEQYRKIGTIGLELAIEAGLAERSTDKISSVVSKEAVNKKGERLSPGQANVSLVKDGVDIMNGDTEIMLNSADYGIRIVGNNVAIDSNGYVREYDNKEGDVLGRINKMLVSSNLEIPNNEPSNEVVVAPTVEPFNNKTIDIKDTVVKLQNTAYSIKPEMMKILEKIKKEVDEDYNGNLDKYLSKNGAWAAQMLGINQYASKSQILAFNDAGVSNGIKDSLRGIIDNLDELKGDLYFTYQIDKNNRITIRETVLNFQADKVIARQILQSANQGTYAMEEGAFDTQVEMLNELGFKADKEGDAKAQYEEAIEIIQKGKSEKRSPEGMTEAQKFAWEIVDILESKQLNESPWRIAARINNPKSKLYKNNGKKTIKAMGIIDGFREIRKSGGTHTNYQVETDAKASGVMNVLMNIIGFDVNAKDEELKVQDLLEQLGVKLSDSEAANISDKDAYNLLQDKVVELLGLDKELEYDIANEEYTDIKGLIEELTGLGIDTRELAKPPVMTWFYTAGTETIVGELAQTLLEQVFRKAIDGDAKALNHINNVLGRTSTDKLDLQKIKVGSREHKKLMNAYREIGKLYESQLEKAFPGVVKFKNAMKDIFETIENTGYANGVIDSAAQAIYGGGGKPGKFNIHKEKQYMLELDAETTKGKKQLGKDLENRQLVTANKLFANFTSLIPLLAQGVDFSILEKTMRELYAKHENDPEFAPMTVHDAIYTAYKFMQRSGKESYNRTIVDVARQYDFVDTIITYGEDTLKRMEEAAKKMTQAELVSHKADMKRLAENIKKWREENNKRIEHKKGKLVKDGEQIEVNLIGGIDLKQETKEGQTKAAEKLPEPKVKSPRKKLIEAAKGLDNPFTEPTVENIMQLVKDYQKLEFGKEVTATIEELGLSLNAKDNTPKEVLKAIIDAKDLTALQDPKETAKTVARAKTFEDFRNKLTDNPKEAVNTLINKLIELDNESYLKTMKDIVTDREIEWKWDEKDEFKVEIAGSKAIITLGKGANTLEQELLERIGHELEHANSAALIENLAEGKGSKEDLKAYNTILKVLKKLDVNKVPEGRLKRVLGEAKEIDKVAETVAVIRGEQQGAESFIEEMKQQGLLSSVANVLVKAARQLISKVRGNKLEYTENLDIDNLVQAVEQIHRSAREASIESDTKINRNFEVEAESKQQQDKIKKQKVVNILRDRLQRITIKQKVPRLNEVLEMIKDC